MLNIMKPQLMFAVVGAILAFSPVAARALSFGELVCKTRIYNDQEELDILRVKLTRRTSLRDQTWFDKLGKELAAGLGGNTSIEPDYIIVTLENADQYNRFGSIVEGNNGVAAVKDFEILEQEVKMIFKEGLPKGTLAQTQQVIGKRFLKPVENMRNTLKNTELDFGNSKGPFEKALGEIDQIMAKHIMRNQTSPALLFRDLIEPLEEIELQLSLVTDLRSKNHMGYALKLMFDGMKAEGVTRVTPKVGKRFDQYMEAQGAYPSETVPQNSVVAVRSSGYFMGGYVLQYAKVAVSSGPAPKASE